MTTVEGTLDLHRRRGREEAATEGTEAVTLSGTFQRVRRGRAIEMREASPAPEPRDGAPAPRPARVAIMLALAHKLQRLLDAGHVGSMGEIAEMLGVTRARVTQILDLTLLASDIQEAIFNGVPIDPVRNERHVRQLTRVALWHGQRALLDSHRAGRGTTPRETDRTEAHRPARDVPNHV